MIAFFGCFLFDLLFVFSIISSSISSSSYSYSSSSEGVIVDFLFLFSLGEDCEDFLVLFRDFAFNSFSFISLIGEDILDSFSFFSFNFDFVSF
jgi:hypothetical protein